jgi:hypothetical protein
VGPFFGSHVFATIMGALGFDGDSSLVLKIKVAWNL